MRFPLTKSQALILVKLINKDRLLKREMSPEDMVILAQVKAIKMTRDGIVITRAGSQRFLKWAQKEKMIS